MTTIPEHPGLLTRQSATSAVNGIAPMQAAVHASGHCIVFTEFFPHIGNFHLQIKGNGTGDFQHDPVASKPENRLGMLCVTLAGLDAEIRFIEQTRGRPITWEEVVKIAAQKTSTSSMGDTVRLENLIDGKDGLAYLELITAHKRNAAILDRRWADIKNLAAALVRHKRLDRNEIVRIVKPPRFTNGFQPIQ